MTPTAVNLLALGDAIAKFDPTFDIARMNVLFDKGSNQTAASLEGILDGLRKMVLGGSITTTPMGDVSSSDPIRLAYYTNLANLQASTAYKSLIGKVTIVTPSTSAGEARSDFGAFLSLVNLTPFALKPNAAASSVLKNINSTNSDLALQWAEDNALTSEERASGAANYSDLWLADRAAMLGWINKRNTADAVDGDASEPQAVFMDHATDTTLNVGAGTVFELTKARYIFGDQDAEANDIFYWEAA